MSTKAFFGINPGSEQVRYTAERDGFLDIFEKLDAKFLLMLVALALVNGLEMELINKKKTQLFTHLIEILLKELMVTQIHTLLLLHQKL